MPSDTQQHPHVNPWIVAIAVIGLVGASWTLYQLSNLNLNAGYWDISWPQLIQGASLAMLFVPLTTATMDPIRKEEMGNATSMFNLMRNLGGGLGIAAEVRS